jgi:hypothetical protein
MPALTKSSPVNMRSILDRTKEEVRALEALGCPTQYWDDILVFMTLRRLDDPTRYEWQIDLTNSDKQRKLVDAAYTPALPTFQQLELFLDHRIRALEMSMVESKPHQGVPIFKSVPVKARVHAVGAAPGSPEEQHAPRSDRRPCPVCKEDHMIYNCETFKVCGLEERRGQVNQLRLCFKCLGSHRLRNCKSIVACRTCVQRHHTLLHDHDKRPNPPTRAPESNPSASVNMVRRLHQTRVVLLATAQVIVCSPIGKQTQTRALFDSGSETTLIAEHVAHKLQLPRTRSTVNICGIGETAAGSSRFQTDVLLKSRVHPDVEYTVTAVILPKLTGCLPRQQIAPVDTLPVNSDDLADPYYFCKAKIGLVLGADIYGSLLRPGLKRSSCKQVAAQDTTLGWIVTGSVSTPEPSRAILQCTSPAETTNEHHRFWETEEVSVPEQPLTPEDAFCEEHFRETYSRNADGRFVVRLPTRPHALLSGDNNRSSCARSLQVLERRFAREPALKERYSSFLTEYERLGHMSVVPPPASDQACWYLPHHAVQQQGPRGTKLRVVFDATRSNNVGCSLNSSLLTGPSLLGDLSLLLLRWRNYRYVFTSDIVKMFRQILVHPDDQDLQRILWNSGEPGSPIDFRLQTVTYGTACAPFLAIRTLRELASLERDNLPLGAASLDDDSYVDDILSGADTLPDALRRRDELIELLAKGKFELGKWAANHRSLLPFGTTEAAASSTQPVLSGQPAKMLGVMWSPASDEFLFEFTPPDPGGRPITKRVVLSWISRIFDPLDWIGPIVVRAKIFLQDLWLSHTGWDEPISRPMQGVPSTDNDRAATRVVCRAARGPLVVSCTEGESLLQVSDYRMIR